MLTERSLARVQSATKEMDLTRQVEAALVILIKMAL